MRIITTLFKGIFSIILLSAIVASPLALWIFGIWHKNYANKVSTNPAVFLLVVFGAFFVGFATSAYHTIKVANTNPVDALKYE